MGEDSKGNGPMGMGTLFVCTSLVSNLHVCYPFPRFIVNCSVSKAVTVFFTLNFSLIRYDVILKIG